MTGSGSTSRDNYELLVRPFPIASDVTIPVGAYGFQDFFASYSMGGQRRFSGTFTLQRGGFFNGNITAYGYRRGRIEITPRFSFEPGISLNRIDLPEGTFTATLMQSRVTYTLTPRMFFGGLLQYNNGTNSLSTNLRLRWEYQPGSELFVVYNDQRDTATLRGTPMLPEPRVHREVHPPVSFLDWASPQAPRGRSVGTPRAPLRGREVRRARLAANECINPRFGLPQGRPNPC